MRSLFTRFAKDESGATAIEYGLIAAGISVAIIAVVQGVGYPNPNRSHFKSMDIWHKATTAATEKFGWLGRCAPEIGGAGDAVLHIGDGEPPLAVFGATGYAPSMRSIQDFQLKTGSGTDGDRRRAAVRREQRGLVRVAVDDVDRLGADRPGRAEDDEQEHERHDDLADEGRLHRVAAGRMLAIAVRGEIAHHGVGQHLAHSYVTAGRCGL